MATTIGKLQFVVSADSSGVRSGLMAGQAALKSFTSNSGLSTLAATLGSGAMLAGATALSGGLLAVGAAVGVVGSGSVRAALDVERLGVSFEVMLGSAEKGQAMLQQLRDLANSTPLETSSLAESAQTLLQFGVEGEKVLPTLRMLGDVSGGDAQRLSQLALVFGQVTSAGKLMGQDLLQLINVGFNPLKLISDELGISYTDLRKKMEQGAITSDMVTTAFKLATAEGGRFNGMMERQADTVGGKWSTLMDSVSNLGALIGEELSPATKAFLDLGIEGVAFLKTQWDDLKHPIGDVVKLLAAGAKEMISWSQYWRGAEQGTGTIKAVAESADTLREKLRTMLEMPGSGQVLSGLKSELNRVRDQIQELEDRYGKAREQIESQRGNFASAAIKGTSAGIMEIARSRQEMGIQQELRVLKEALVTELRALKDQEARTTEAAKDIKPAQVQESRI